MIEETESKPATKEMLRCSFCHKSQDAVAKLISSPSDYPRVYICDECVAVCNSILEDDRKPFLGIKLPSIRLFRRQRPAYPLSELNYISFAVSTYSMMIYVKRRKSSR